jgi:adenine-specific DNA methylase
MNEIGHNNPPSLIDAASDVANSINDWLKDNPVVETEVQARAAKLQIDRAKLCLKDLKDERDIKLKPLADQVSTIRMDYQGPSHLLDTTLSAVESRLTDFIRAERQRREEEARKAFEAAETAKQAALEAERQEREALDNARLGEIGVDVVTVTKAADEAFEQAIAAERRSLVAQRDTHVKVGGGFKRAISLRNKEELIVFDPVTAVAQIGFTEGIRDAILTAARAYRKLNGKLPDGIRAETRQEI